MEGEVDPSMPQIMCEKSVHRQPAATCANQAVSTPTPQQPMSPATPCEHIVEFTDRTETRRRIRFVPCECGEYQRIEQRWQDGDWRLVGQDTVSDVDYWTRQPTR